jgi:septum formation inhibitor-activating ATPase MinD
VHEENTEVVVVPSVEGGVGPLTEVTSLGELVAASGVAAPLVLLDASDTVAAELVSDVHAGTQAPCD